MKDGSPKVLHVITAQLIEASMATGVNNEQITESKTFASYFFGFAYNVAYQFTDDIDKIKEFVTGYFVSFYGEEGGALITAILNRSDMGDREVQEAIDLGAEDAQSYVKSLSDGLATTPSGLLRCVRERRTSLEPLFDR